MDLGYKQIDNRTYCNKKGQSIWFFFFRIRVTKHETETKKRQPLQKHWKKKQRKVFLNRYDFAYAGRDILNQLGKVAHGVIKSASWDINKIVQQKINQILFQGGQKMERVLLKILHGAIEDVYQMSFRNLGNFGKQQLQKLKKKILKWYFLIVFTRKSCNNQAIFFVNVFTKKVKQQLNDCTCL